MRWSGDVRAGGCHATIAVARRAVCLSNLRQIACALHTYGADNSDRIPGSQLSADDSDSRSAPTWPRALFRYVAGHAWTPELHRPEWVAVLNGIYHCPLDPLRTEPAETVDHYSYGLNAYLGPPPDELREAGVAWERLAAIPRPAATVAFADANLEGLCSVRTDFVTAHFWVLYAVDPATELAVDRHRSRAAPTRCYAGSCPSRSPSSSRAMAGSKASSARRSLRTQRSSAHPSGSALSASSRARPKWYSTVSPPSPTRIGGMSVNSGTSTPSVVKHAARRACSDSAWAASGAPGNSQVASSSANGRSTSNSPRWREMIARTSRRTGAV